MPNEALLTISGPFLILACKGAMRVVLPSSEVLQCITYMTAYTLIFF